MINSYYEKLEENKKTAFDFLKRLQIRLSDELPTGGELSKQVRENQRNSSKKFNQPENAFIYGDVLPILHSLILEAVNGNIEAARQSLLSESWKAVSKISSGSPKRLIPYPFKKALGSNAKDIVKLWQSPSGVVSSLWPDFATRPPLPYKIVFEGKYSDGNVSESKAMEILASNIYQGFFYRGLPETKGEGDNGDYHYDYACVLIGDGTPNRILTKVWDSLDPKVKSSFWDGANIFVLII